MNIYSRSVRIPLSLKEMILQNKGDKSINQYVIEQIIGNNSFSEKDYEFLDYLIQKNLKKSGNRINVFARELNRKEIAEVDQDIMTYIDIYLDNLLTIKNKKIRSVNIEKDITDTSIKSYYLRLRMSKEEKQTLLKNVYESGMKASDYIRFRLYNYTKYSGTDFLKLERELNDNLYRTISNINQIKYKYSFIKGAEGFVRELDRRRIAIRSIEKEIHISWEEYYGNNKNHTYKSQ